MAGDNNTKKKFGLLGRNISYSLSPAMHNAAFGHFNIPAEYTLLDIDMEKEKSFSIRDFAFERSLSGFNVTVPYKVDVYKALKTSEFCSVDEVSDVLGAVNTVVSDGEGLKGYNTDGRGFYESLKTDASFDTGGKVVFISGSGGAGRAISIYLSIFAPERPEKVFIYDPVVSRSTELESVCAGKAGTGICTAVREDKIEETIKESDLFVNATPLGTKPSDPVPLEVALLKKGAVVYDLVYARETELVSDALKKGHKAVSGAGMLINQGALAFNIWTQQPFDEVRQIMEKVIFEKLGLS